MNNKPVFNFRVGERVRVEGREGEFMVLDVDPEKARIELLCLTPSAHIERDVPAAAIKPAHPTSDAEPNRAKRDPRNS